MKNLSGKVTELKKGQILILDNVRTEILGIKNEDITNNFGNNQSVVYKLYIGDTSLLFLGDTGLESEEKLKESMSERLKSDYVQMAHHGQAGVSEEFYRLVSPKYCMWPCTCSLYNNDFGHGYNTGDLKTIETRKWIESLGAINYVAKDGDIKIKIY